MITNKHINAIEWCIDQASENNMSKQHWTAQQYKINLANDGLDFMRELIAAHKIKDEERQQEIDDNGRFGVGA